VLCNWLPELCHLWIVIFIDTDCSHIILVVIYYMMGMCCEKKMMIGWRNISSMKLRVQDQEEDQRGPGERLYERTARQRKMNKVDSIDRCKWRKMIKDVRWSGWVWVGECFFWYRPTRVVPDQRPLNGCVYVCVFYYMMCRWGQSVIFMVEVSVLSFFSVL